MIDIALIPGRALSGPCRYFKNRIIMKTNFKPIAEKVLVPLRFIKEFITVDLKKLIRSFIEHDSELSICALAFYTLISFIPASLVIISILSFFYKSESMANFYLNEIKNQLPAINIDDLINIIDRIIYKKRYIALFWVPFLFWWGSLIFDVIERILEKAFRIKESRKYFKAKIRHFIIILGIGIIVLAFIVLSNILALVQNTKVAQLLNQILNDSNIFTFITDFIMNIPSLMKSLTAIFTNAFLLFIIYRFVPPRTMSNGSIIKGTIFASISYLLVKTLFSYYITEINDYSSIFGSLSSVVMLMIWIWFTCFLFVAGAEMAWIFHEKSVKKL